MKMRSDGLEMMTELGGSVADVVAPRLVMALSWRDALD